MRLVLLLLCLPLVGCTPLRLFQTKVPPPVTKPETQVEAERQAADLIARTIETPIELRPVAVSLSTSLGVPLKSLVNAKATFDLPTVAKHADVDLNVGIATLQRKLDDTNRKLTSLQGKSVDNTGLSILGPSTVLIIGGLVALGVLCPPALTFLWFVFKRLRTTAGMIVNKIDETSKDPAAVETINKIKQSLRNEMDLVHKQVVHSLQQPR